MKTYDEVVGFDYTNAEEWQSFVKNQVLPLHRSISKVVKLRKSLEELFSNNLSDLIRNNTNIKQILLGGVDENGDYKPNSLARMYRKFLGISVNTKEWVSMSKQPGIDAAEYIKCNFTDTPFLQFVKDIKEIVDRLLYLVEISDEEVKDDEIRDILENPEKIVNELKKIYIGLVGISANHSYYTFFTINTRCIPRYYIERAYPKLKDKFEEVAEFLGLEPKFVPDIKEEKIKRNYTLWGHKENGFADLLYELNRIIWEYFGREGFRRACELIALFRDLKQEYLKKIIDEKLFRELAWRFPDYINPHMWGKSKSPYWHREYEIDGLWLDKCYEVPSWSNHGERKVKFEGKSLTELFSDISPALFLGYICYYDEKYYAHFESVHMYTLIIRGNRLRIKKEER